MCAPAVAARADGDVFVGVQKLAGFVVRGCTGANNNGALFINSEIRVHNCTLERNSGYNGAVQIGGGSPVLSSVVVANNSPNSAVFVVGGTPSFVDCRFVGNEVSGTGNNGGALYVYDAQVQLTSSTFERNTAAAGSSGGAVALISGSLSSRGCQFVGNEVSGGGYGGGALIMQGGQVQLTSSTFESNTAADGSVGGAVAVMGGSLSSSACHFVGNQMSGGGGAGGALYLQSGQVQLTNSTFESNIAANGSAGGAVAVKSGSLSSTTCLFKGNSVSGGSGGGALCLWSLGQVQLTDTIFDSNSAADGSYGGAVAVLDGSLNSRGCQFMGNTVSGDGNGGGALYLQSPGQVQLTKATFSGNAAADGNNGGAVAVLGGSLSLSDTAFKQNTAHKGGAVWWQLNNWTLLCELAATCTFTSNYADVAGGAMFSSIDARPPECVYRAVRSIQQQNNTAGGYGNGIASNPRVQLVSVQGESYVPSAIFSVYPDQPISFVISVHDALGQPCAQSPPVGLSVSTSPYVPHIWASNSKLNATGYANVVKSNAIRLLQTARATFVMTLTAKDASSNTTVHFRPVVCPAG